jgi:chemotaxis protein histidine kinase CheA
MVSPDAVRSVNAKAGDIVLVGADINVVYSATNYTAATDSIRDHFAGVDTKLGTLALAADLTAFQTEVADTYATKFDADNDRNFAAMTYETKADANQFKINVENDYFSKADAATLKQEIETDYATKTELSNQADYNDTTYYTKAEAQAAGQGNAASYATKTELSDLEASVADTYETKAHASDTYQTKASAADAKTLADATYESKSDASMFASTVAATYETKADATAFASQVSTTYETKTHASDTYLAKTDAASTYETQAHASATYETATHAAATYDTKTNTANTFIAKSAYTAAGDILVGSGAGSYAKLGKGTNGQILSIDSSGNVVWATQPTPVTSLSALTDVALSNPTAGQALVYNGTKWANATINTSSATGDKITTGTTSVQTAEVANTVTVNANGKRVANFIGGASTAGERLDVTADNGKLTLAATNTAGSGAVDLEIRTQGAGAVKFNLAGTASIRSGAGEALLIQPGDAASGDGVALTIVGGSGTAAGSAGGDIMLSSGTPGAGGVAGQVKLSAGYVPASSDSVVNKSYVDGRRLDQIAAPTSAVNANNQTISNVKDPVADQDVANRRFVVSRASQFDVNIVTTGGTYNVTGTDYMILVKASTNVSTTVVLPAAANAVVGKAYTIKDAKGSSDVTIRGANNETIDGQPTQTLSYAYEALTVLWNGSEWNII